MPDPPSTTDAPLLSVVIPALDEEDNVQPLVEQVHDAMQNAGVTYELIIVDDGSSDETCARLTALKERYSPLRVLHRDKPQGQSAAMYAGIRAAGGRYVATLDADLQNDPGDLPAMLTKLEESGADMVQGDRSANRRDNVVRRYGSIVGRKARAWLLGDAVRDTGCSARVMRAELAKQVPLQFRGMHRFIPVYIRIVGGEVLEMPANHRPRVAGQTKYGLGVLNRGIVGFFDLLSVRWMSKRYRNPAAEELCQQSRSQN